MTAQPTFLVHGGDAGVIVPVGAVWYEFLPPAVLQTGAVPHVTTHGLTGGYRDDWNINTLQVWSVIVIVGLSDGWQEQTNKCWMHLILERTEVACHLTKNQMKFIHCQQCNGLAFTMYIFVISVLAGNLTLLLPVLKRCSPRTRIFFILPDHQQYSFFISTLSGTDIRLFVINFWLNTTEYTTMDYLGLIPISLFLFPH